MLEKTRFLIPVIGVLMTLLFVGMITTASLAQLKEHNQQQGFITADQRLRDLDCLALNIYREAGYEPFEGKVGVAQVTLNRAESGKFPGSVCQVVYQKNVIYQKVICQFSWYCDQVHRSRPINPEAYAESMVVAKKVLLEGFRLPSLENAMYYHADYVNPGWRLPKITKIGRHIFYGENS
jgi:spore germination cell wall hydrolase CwlJ-like protein